MDKTGRANGLYFDNQQRIIACADEQNELRAITLKKKVTVLLDNFEGQKLNGPNDLWVDKKGGIYFTDPYYQRDYWQRKKPDMKGCYVYYLPKGKSKALIVDSLLVQPNGIVGKADGSTLYVADINDNKTYRYQINADGSLTNRQLFVAQGSDGMTIDREGNIYLAGVGCKIGQYTRAFQMGGQPVFRRSSPRPAADHRFRIGVYFTDGGEGGGVKINMIK
jgi:gluconolactonase